MNLPLASHSRLPLCAAPAPLRWMPIILLALLLTPATALAQDDLEQRRQRILTDGQAQFWRLRDPREVLTLDRITDPRSAWARIELLTSHDPRTGLDQAQALLDQTLDQLRHEWSRRADALRTRTGAAGDYNTGWPPDAATFDNDPLYWEFDLLPPDSRSIALAGLWRFQTDPTDQGLARGYARTDFNDRDWPTLYAPAATGWEHQSQTPYDGIAWYRKTLIIPAAWTGHDLRLHLGEPRANLHWLSINGRFIHPPNRPGDSSPDVRIPASLVRFGRENTLAIRIHNQNGPGGLFGPDLRLSTLASHPGVSRFACGAGHARQIMHRTHDLPMITCYSSAISPAALIASTHPELHLAGWTARGYLPPRRCTFISRGAAETIDINETASLDPRSLDENWLLLWPARPDDHAPRPLMLVFERRPASIAFAPDGFGARALQLRFSSPGARIAIIRPFAAIFSAPLTPEHFARCRLWSRALLRYPIGYLHRADPQNNLTHFAFEYLELHDDWNTQPLSLAPVPAPLGQPAPTDPEPTDLGCRPTPAYTTPTNPANYFALPSLDHLTCTLPLQR